MIRAHYYNLKTGLLTGSAVTAPTLEVIAANCPPGCGWAEAEAADHTRQKVQHVTDDFGDVQACLVPYRPPKPKDTVAVCWLWSEADQAWQPELTVAAHMANARAERDRRLSECDWVVTKAQETGQPVPAPWRDYRQALRDVSKQPGFPTSVVWPTKPE